LLSDFFMKEAGWALEKILTPTHLCTNFTQAA
jgi:hypothetical protein